MRCVLRVLMALVFIAIISGGPTASRADETPTFANIPWGASKAVVRAKMQQHGYTFAKVGTLGTLEFKGTLDHQRTEIDQQFDASGRLVKTSVYLLTTDDQCRDVYNETVAALTAKYGEPTNSDESYIYPFEKGDGYFKTAVRADKAHIVSLWHIGETSHGAYGITVSIEKNLTVYITYESSRWPARSDQIQQKATNDL